MCQNVRNGKKQKQNKAKACKMQIKKTVEEKGKLSVNAKIPAKDY